MTDKELKHLSRMELIDIIYELQKQNEQNAAQIEKLQAALDEKELHIENAGSIAEAAVQISGVLEAAQAAADQYLLSIRAATADMDAMAQAAEQQRDALLADAKNSPTRCSKARRASPSGWCRTRRAARRRSRTRPKSRSPKSGIASSSAPWSLFRPTRNYVRLSEGTFDR